MVKRLLLVILLLIFSSCYLNQMSVRKLKNGITRVPMDSLYFYKEYDNKIKVKVPEIVDTKSIYVETHHLSGSKKTKYYTKYNYSAFKFYSNGNVNNFLIGNVDKETIESYNFDPEFSGLRGVTYYEKGDWRIDIIGSVSEIGTIGTIGYKIIQVSQDTLKLQRVIKNSETIYVYVRKEVKNDSILGFNANW